jgi:hypothetical protein
MAHWPGLLGLQSRILTALHKTGVFKDSAVAAEVADLADRPCDRTTVVGWRAGRTQAPLGLLGVLLGYPDSDAERAEVATALLRPWGLRAQVIAPDRAVGKALGTLALDISICAGRIAGEVQGVLEDGVVDAAEAEQLQATAAELRALADQLDVAARVGRTA